MSDETHRSGYVTLIGRPNVGKSTLLNRMLGEKIAITSPRPQTTRNRIPGVLTRPDAQIVFIDTPGLHRADRALNQYMLDIARGAISDSDVLALIIEAGVGPDNQVEVGQATRALLDELKAFGKPVYLVINKIDQLDKRLALPVIDAYRQVYDFAEIVPISALQGLGVPELVDLFARALPEGPNLYPEDALTDLPERFIVAEIVREKAFRLLEKEVPYATAVTIERWRDRTDRGLVEIDAIIHVERDSQKGIVIGKGGAMIKQIGTRAREDIERLLGTQVNLKLFVRVEKGWTRSDHGLRKLGYE